MSTWREGHFDSSSIHDEDESGKGKITLNRLDSSPRLIEPALRHPMPEGVGISKTLKELNLVGLKKAITYAGFVFADEALQGFGASGVPMEHKFPHLHPTWGKFTMILKDVAPLTMIPLLREAKLWGSFSMEILNKVDVSPYCLKVIRKVYIRGLHEVFRQGGWQPFWVGLVDISTVMAIRLSIGYFDGERSAVCTGSTLP